MIEDILEEQEYEIPKLRLPRPHPAQQHILDTRKRFNVLNCGRRFGKTNLAIYLIVEAALFKQQPVAYFVDKFRTGDDVWPKLKRILKPWFAGEQGSNEVKREINLQGGGKIKLWSLSDDCECSRGFYYGRIIIDEAAKIDKLMQAWEFAIRPNLVDLKGDAYFCSTPRGRNGFWELFQAGLNPEEPDWACWTMPSYANPHISSTELDKMIEGFSSRDIARQEVFAEFREQSGKFFETWDESVHVVDALPGIPSHWKIYAGLDYGQTSSRPTFAVVFAAADEDGNLWLFDEIYKSGTLADEQAQLIKQHYEHPFFGRNGTIAQQRLIVACPPEIFPPDDPRKRVGQYPVESYWRNGIGAIKADHSRLAGWDRVKQWMKEKGNDGHPRLRVMRGCCPNLIRTIPLQTYDERQAHCEDLDTSNPEDHLVDALRMLVMTRPKPSAPQLDVDPEILAIRARIAEIDAANRSFDPWGWHK